MGINSKIEWCDHTWNPWYGCPDDGKRTPACDNCYARAWAKRSGIVDFDNEIKRASEKTFYVPLDRKKFKSGDKVFVCSLSDFFHYEIPISAWWDSIADVILKRPDLIWIFLTKRPRNINDYFYETKYFFCESNRWLGVTVENQEQADERIPLLLETSASVRFVSCEPLLGEIDFSDNIENLDWVICGGESGGKARPMHVDWVRSLRDQCEAESVPFMFKQWGKQQAGKILDGKEYLEFPEKKGVRDNG